MAERTERIEELDGLRGLAILLVVLCHATMAFGEIGELGVFEWLVPLGGSGVNLFFVLSGFLISGILIDGRDKGVFLTRFYLRRLIRIVPAFYFCLIVYSLVLPILFPEGNGFSRSWLEDPWVHFSFLSNFYYFFKGTFGSDAMSVSWSLAIEEQFYLVWPLIFCFLPRRTLMPVCVLLVILANIVRWQLILRGYNADQVMVFTPARFDSFAFGGILALCWRSTELWMRLARYFPVILFLSGLSASGFQIFISLSGNEIWTLYGSISFFFGTLFYVALLGLALSGFKSVSGVQGGSLVRGLSRFFCSSGMQEAGKLSYSVYLTHLGIIYALVLIGFNPADFLGDVGGILIFYIVAIAASFAVGWALYRLVDAPALSLKNRF